MKHLHSCFIVLLLVSGAIAQTPPLVTRYDRLSGVTYVDTYRLNVIDEPSQFLQIQFSGAFSATYKPSQPFQTSISISSLATEALYRRHSSSRLVAYADGETIPIGLAIYDLWYFQQTMESNKRVTKPPLSGLRAKAIPAGTKIEKDHALKDLVQELLVVEPVSLDDLRKLARATHVEMQIGSTRFQLNDTQVDRLRLFTKSITPPGDGVENVSAEGDPGTSKTPSDANNASLKQTMEWLKSKLSDLGKGEGLRQRAEFDSHAFAKCQFSYSFVSKTSMLRTGSIDSTPAGNSNPKLTTSDTGSTHKTEFRVDFADLDPDAVYVWETPFGMFLRYATNDSELKIKKDSTSDGSGGPYSHWEDKYLYQAQKLDLKKDGYPAQLHDSFVHAIRLCQEGRGK